MRGPKEALRESGRREGPVGAKVLQRLELFSEARGLHTNGFFVETAGEEERVTRISAVSAEAGESIARIFEETTEEDEAIARTYAETALSLQAEEGRLAITREASPGTLTLPPAWRLLGPTMMPNGQTYGDTRVVVSGRIAAIAIDPFNANHILCGSAAGGVWESRDAGATWTPRTDAMPTLTVGALAFDPSSPNKVYCGTGEGNFYARLGAGVLRSTDGGATWSVLASSPFVGQGFYDLIVDPANGNHLLAATTSGLYESSDGGSNWTRRRTAKTWDLSMHPSGGASAEVLAACVDGLFRSTDGGQTWAQVALPSGAPTTWDRLAVDHARSNPTVAYAFGARGNTAYLYRCNSSGTWQSITVPSGLSTGQAWYDWFVAAAPDRDNQVYLGAIEAYRGELSGTTWTWTTISNKSGDDTHPDQHAIAFNPANPDVIYLGNDGGLYRSPNRGMNWVSLNNGLAITEIEYITQDYGSSRWLLGGTQDNGSTRYTGSSVWDHVADGDGGDCGVNRSSPNIVFHSYYGMGMERSTTKGDFGSFSWIGPNVPGTYRALFYPPMEANGTTVAQAGQSVFISRNNGSNWTEVALPANLTASAMYIPTPDRVFVGTTDGRIFRIDWSGSAWSAANELTSPRAAWISDLFIDSNNLNRIWTTFTTIGGGRVFRSDDGGSNWQDRSAGLPNLPINAVEVDPANTNRVWVAADLGIYQSFDGGSTWASFSRDLPNVLVADLLFHPHARVLRAGTRNRGVWEIPVDGWLSEPICGVQWVGNLPGNGSQRWYTFNWPATWHVIWTVMPTSPRPGSPQITWNVQVERASAEYVTYWIAVTNLMPDPVTFEGRYGILSRY